MAESEQSAEDDNLGGWIDQALADGHDLDTVLLVARTRLGAAEANLARLQWASSIEALASGLVELCTSPYDWNVRPSSIAASDVAAPSLNIGSRSEPFADLLRYETALNIRMTADHLQGFAALVGAQRSVLGSASVARGIFEACTWASALIDPAVSQRERLRRLIMRRIVRFMAEERERDMLAASDPSVAAKAAAVVEGTEDEHGSHLDPATEIEDLAVLAKTLGWNVKPRERRIDLDGALSIGGLVKSLGQRVGVEEYVWGTGSALAHGEHSRLTTSLVEIVQNDLGGQAPGWITQFHTAGSWAGPRLFLSTFAEYTKRNHLLAEFTEMDRRYRENTVKK